MNSVTLIQNALKQYKANELIFASKLYRSVLENQVSEAAYYKTLERLCKSGKLVKIAKGTYHLPKVTKYGVVPPSEKEIVNAFTENEMGTTIGYTLYNSLGLTTQISKNIDVLSSELDGLTKSIRNITIHRVQITYNDPVKSMIHCLEVLNNYSKIEDINYLSFIKFTKTIAESYNEEVFETVYNAMNYKKSTIAFLQEILNYYNRENNLRNYLSSLSEYKYPKMEKIYEAARIKN